MFRHIKREILCAYSLTVILNIATTTTFISQLCWSRCLWTSSFPNHRPPASRATCPPAAPLRRRGTSATGKQEVRPPSDTLTTHDCDALFSSWEVFTGAFSLSWDRHARRGELSGHHVSGLGVRHRYGGSRT